MTAMVNTPAQVALRERLAAGSNLAEGSRLLSVRHAEHDAALAEEARAHVMRQQRFTHIAGPRRHGPVV